MRRLATHELLTHFVDYDAVRSGHNPMLIRRDLRFQMGDIVKLTRQIGLRRGDIDPNAPVLVAWVSAVLRDRGMGLLPGYVVLHLVEICEERKAA